MQIRYFSMILNIMHFIILQFSRLSDVVLYTLKSYLSYNLLSSHCKFQFHKKVYPLNTCTYNCRLQSNSYRPMIAIVLLRPASAKSLKNIDKCIFCFPQVIRQWIVNPYPAATESDKPYPPV